MVCHFDKSQGWFVQFTLLYVKNRHTIDIGKEKKWLKPLFGPIWNLVLVSTLKKIGFGPYSDSKLVLTFRKLLNNVTLLEMYYLPIDYQRKNEQNSLVIKKKNITNKKSSSVK